MTHAKVQFFQHFLTGRSSRRCSGRAQAYSRLILGRWREGAGFRGRKKNRGGYKGYIHLCRCMRCFLLPMNYRVFNFASSALSLANSSFWSSSSLSLSANNSSFSASIWSFSAINALVLSRSAASNFRLFLLKLYTMVVLLPSS